MNFYEVVGQTAKLLQQQGRLTYRTLRRQFDLDDEALEDLKDENCFSHILWSMRMAEGWSGPVKLTHPLS
jgi:hypothetical protein